MQVPARNTGDRNSRWPAEASGFRYGEGARIVRWGANSTVRVLTPQFESAGDPDISFDGRRMLFAGKRTRADHWNIFEMDLETLEARQVTQCPGDCRSPVYRGTLYTLESPEPWYEVSFVAFPADNSGAAGSIYSCRLDGSELRRITFTPAGDVDPVMLADGRLLFSSWQRSGKDNVADGPRRSLFTANIDGSDHALFAGVEGRRLKHMPCVTAGGLVVFVEDDPLAADGAGSLGAVSLRRNLHSYRAITRPPEGLFHSPSAVADGSVLVSRRPATGAGNYGVYQIDPASGAIAPVFDDPHFDDIQAKALAPREQPDGRSTSISEKDENGEFYGVNVYVSDVGERWVKPGSPLRLRVIEAVLAPGREATRRLLGEAPVEADGSFYVKVPANTPVQFQLLDSDGLALRTSQWTWTRNHKAQGCVGCHEDPEWAPENRFAEALRKPPANLTLPPERRRSVDFRRDVAPILAARCSAVACHGGQGSKLRLGTGDELATEAGARRAYQALIGERGRYVDAGRARTSPLIWSVFGRNTSRPWDASAGAMAPMKAMPLEGALTGDEKRALAEWVDLEAPWSGQFGAAPGTRPGRGPGSHDTRPGATAGAAHRIGGAR